MGLRSSLRRYHVWLGWLVGVPMLFWTVSGLVMVARPIEEVRGTDLLKPVAPIPSTAGFTAPIIQGRSLTQMSLESRAAGPRWIVRFADGDARLADPATGRLLPPLGAPEAAREVAARYAGTATVAGTSRVAADSPPLELRRTMNGWRVAMSDGTHFYVDSGSGEIVARRTKWWRVYDFMWGLHIMDLEGREETDNPWVVTFSALSLAMVLLALVMMPLTIRRKGKRRKPVSSD